jgi:hypothetical protein
VEARDPRPAAAHPAHDQLLIARLAVDDVNDTERATAQRLVLECAGCASLLADISAISTATRHDLPIPRRSRDFRLSADDAEQLRGRPRFLTWLRGALGPGGSIVQPLAGAALSVGLALVVAGTVLPAPSQSGLEVRGPSSAARSTGAPAAASGASGSDGTASLQTPEASPAGGQRNSQASDTGSAAASAAAPPPPAASEQAAAASEPAAGSPAASLPAASALPFEATFGSAGASGESTPQSALSSPQPAAASTGVDTGSATDEPGAGTMSATEQPSAAVQGGPAEDQGSSTPTTGAAAGPGVKPAQTDEDAAATDEDAATTDRSDGDRRPLLVLAGFLLLLSGTVLLGMRRVSRRA